MTYSESVTTRDFHIGDIISITDGALVSPRHIDGVCDILGWMTGETLFTHQLPRAGRECEDNLRAQHPDIAAIVFPDTVEHTEAGVSAWLDEQVAIYGETRPVAPLAKEDHTPIDPIAEFKMIAPDKPIIVVGLPDE